MRKALIAIVSYLSVVLIVYFTQRLLQYAPDNSYPGKPAQNGLSEMQEIRLTSEDGINIYAWFAAPKEQDGKIFIIYHGNAGNLLNRVDKAKKLADRGYGVYLCEYRGYGGNSGKPSEDGLYKDARSAIKWLEKKGYNISQFVLYGESIGSGVAVHMAQEYKTKYLVLEGGFSSAVDVAKSVYPWLPVTMLLKDRYDNMQKIKNIKTSLLMLHGINDKVVNIKYGRKLYEEANHPKQFMAMEKGGHVDLFDYGADDVIKKWLETQ